MEMARRSCEGARLYLQSWDNKPPGFFLYLQPFCLVRAPSADLTIVYEPLLFWLPILLLNGATLAFLASASLTGAFPAFVFGLFSGAFLWSGRVGELFSTEYLAASFVNPKFAAFGWLYAFARPLSWRQFSRDLVVSLGFALLVFSMTTGLRPSDLAAIFRTVDVGGYWPMTARQRIDLFLSGGLF